MMVHYKDMKALFRSSDVDTVLQVYIPTAYLLIIYLKYILRTSINLKTEDVFIFKKNRSTRYPAENMTDADYAKDLVLLTLA